MKGEVVEDALLVLDANDNVATALRDLEVGEEFDIEAETVQVREAIEFGHKVALANLDPDDAVYKYGEVVGRTTSPVHAGEWVHTHNLASTRGRGDARDKQEGQP